MVPRDWRVVLKCKIFFRTSDFEVGVGWFFAQWQALQQQVCETVAVRASDARTDSKQNTTNTEQCHQRQRYISQ